MVSKLVGASVWEERLYDHLTSHDEAEREMLEQYQAAASDSDSPAFRYLASLIIEDEIRHHRVFRELAETLRRDAEMRPGDPAVPHLQWGADAQRVVDLSGALLEHEKADSKSLREVERELSDVKDTTLWHLLVKIAEMDTAKHIMILEFARDHAARRHS
jgi:rubrerythrin